MGYTHYWRRPQHLNIETFNAFLGDVKKIVDFSENSLGIKLADGLGKGEPHLTPNLIRLNGSEFQPVGKWTTTEGISIPWPAGCADLKELNEDPNAPKIGGDWFAGHLLLQRVAPINSETGLGSGDYETFSIPRIVQPEDYTSPDRHGRFFAFCKTAYRPYDLPITAILISFKHYFKDSVVVSSDGEPKNWRDGQLLCYQLFQYGLDFKLNGDE